MKIIIPTDFFSTLKDKFLLLDTSVFIDASINAVAFTKFFTDLKNNKTLLVTLDVVKMEFLKGSVDAQKYSEKKEFFEQIIDVYFPISKDISDNAYMLLQLYKEDGRTLSITDLFLGATLMYYKTNLFLLTKNTTDFPTNIFTLSTYINLSHRKGIHTYGVYQYIRE